MKNLEDIKNAIPEFGRDSKINLQKIIDNDEQILSNEQVYMIALSSAYATKEKDLILALEGEFQDKLSSDQIKATKIATSMMAMNNIYYRFIHLSHDNEYLQMPAGLRMQSMANSGINKVDFEILSLAVSIINGCGMCIVSHSKALQKENINKQQIQLISKISSVINSVAQILIIK